MIIDNSKIIKKKDVEEEVQTVNNCIKMNDQGNMVRVKTWEPAGTPDGFELKRDITELLDEIVKGNSDHTLAEMGYLNMSLISYSDGQIRAKVFFAPELATQTTSNGVNTDGKIIPHPALNVFQNWLFVGDLKDAVTFESMPVPKYEIERNNRDQLAIRIKDGKKVTEDGEAVVLNCNLLILMAAIVDTNLWDPAFKVEVETVGKSKKKENDMAIMINAGARQEFPVRITVTYTVSNNPYIPDDAVPYLMDRVKKLSDANATKKKLANKASDRAKETAKESKKSKSSWRKYM